MFIWRHYFFDAIVGGICLSLLAILFHWTRDLGRNSRWISRVLILGAFLVVVFTVALAPNRIGKRFPDPVVIGVRVAGISTAAFTMYFFALALMLRLAPARTKGRRDVLKLAAATGAVLPVGLAAAAYIKREDLQLVEMDIAVPGLPPDLQGLRIVQITDLHMSPLVSESFVARAVDMANEARGSIAIVTGDLVTRQSDPLDKCLRQLARLRSEAGTFGCLGNHEIYAGAEEYTTVRGRRLGLQFLRSESRVLRFGNASLNLVGVDYQRAGSRYLVGTDEFVDTEAVNVLLTHNPDVFPVAAAQGFNLTLAGHTHGGQVSFEMLHPALNIARFYTPFIHGLYEAEGSRMYVSRGVGTIGVPARLGAPPEVSVLRLCAISS